jgi:hypothetical protein
VGSKTISLRFNPHPSRHWTRWNQKDHKINDSKIANCAKLTNQQIGQQSSRLPAARALQKKCGVFVSEAALMHAGLLSSVILIFYFF